MKKVLKTVKKVLKTVFWIIWIGLLIFDYMGMVAGGEKRDASMVITGIILIVIWLVLTIGVTAIKWHIDDKKKEKMKREYNEKYVSAVEYTDEKFGKIILQHDINRGTLKAEIPNVDFDGKLTEVSICVEDNSDITGILHNLNQYCSNAKEIKERIYVGLAKYLKDADIYDQDDNLIEITEEFLRDQFDFGWIRIDSEEFISLWWSLDDSGSQDYFIDYDVENDTFTYGLL